MTARSNESTKEVRTGQQLFEEITLNMERNLAKKLGNSKRFEKWRKAKFFAAARREWLDAWRRYLGEKDLGSMFKIRAGVQHDLEALKDFMLGMLRHSGHPQEVLKRQAKVIDALSKADPEFLKKKRLAQRSAGRRTGDGSDLSYDILAYWFPGLLWLMSDKAGLAALCVYTNKKIITVDAYRKARERLGLNGHRDRVKAPPVLWYEPVTGTYKYGP